MRKFSSVRAWWPVARKLPAVVSRTNQKSTVQRFCKRKPISRVKRKCMSKFSSVQPVGANEGTVARVVSDIINQNDLQRCWQYLRASISLYLFLPPNLARIRTIWYRDENSLWTLPGNTAYWHCGPKATTFRTCIWSAVGDALTEHFRLQARENRYSMCAVI